MFVHASVYQNRARCCRNQFKRLDLPDNGLVNLKVVCNFNQHQSSKYCSCFHCEQIRFKSVLKLQSVRMVSTFCPQSVIFAGCGILVDNFRWRRWSSLLPGPCTLDPPLRGRGGQGVPPLNKIYIYI